MAPPAAGSALIGEGPGEAQRLLSWDAASTAELFTHAGASAALRAELASFDAAVAYTRSADLARNLAAAIPRVIVHDPRPPAGAGHAADWLARPLSALGVPRDEGPPLLVAAREERDEVAALRRDLPDRFLTVHPGSGSASKSWPAERFGLVLDALGVDRFLLVEGPADAKAAGGLRTRKGAVAARGLAPRLLGAIVAQAAAYVGNDSGVTHLAAAWGAPTVALFGPTDPGVWSPVGPRVTIVRGPQPRMDGIAVEAVVGAVAPLLAEKGSD